MTLMFVGKWNVRGRRWVCLRFMRGLAVLSVLGGMVGNNGCEESPSRPSVDPPLVDATRPARVRDLAAAISAGGSTLMLTWTAVGDDSLTGRAQTYDARSSTSAITEQNFDGCARVLPFPDPGPPGATESAPTSIPVGSNAVYYRLKVTDEVGNFSYSNQCSMDIADRVPPDPVDDLEVVERDVSTIELRWTAPGDDGSTGTASAYDLRYSTDPHASFEVMVEVPIEPPNQAGSFETATIDGLRENADYYFLLKARDDRFNWSEESNRAQGRTLEAVHNGIDLDGIDDRIVVPDGPSWNSIEANDRITIEAWIRIDGWSGEWFPVVEKYDNDYGGWNIQIRSGMVNWIAGVASEVDLPFSCQLGRWYHIAVAYDRSRGEAKLVVDGSLAASRSLSGDLMDTGSGPFYIGFNPYGGDEYSNGGFDEVRVWNYARTPDEIRRDMYVELTGSEPGLVACWSLPEGQNSRVEDKSPNGNHGTLVRGPTLPGRVSDLEANPTLAGCVTLEWTATGAEGAVGRAAAYDIRYHTSPIDSEASWNQAAQATDEPIPGEPGTAESFEICGLAEGATYHFAMRVQGEGSWSEISNSPEARIPGDTIAPGRASLRVCSVSPGTVTLCWTAPGDDLYAGGPAEAYQLLRGSGRPDTTSVNVPQVPMPHPGEPGAAETISIGGLEPGTEYWFALRSRDDANNWSPYSVAETSTSGAWIQIGGTLNQDVKALAVSPNGQLLIAGGEFTSINGRTANGIASWNGNEWASLEFPYTARVNTLEYDPEGKLWAGGAFNGSRGNVAVRTGTSWSIPGDGLKNDVYDLAYFRGEMYASGHFYGQVLDYIARWDGSGWKPVGSGLQSAAYTMATDGRQLLVGGRFDQAGGLASQNVAVWDGAWHALCGLESNQWAVSSIFFQGEWVVGTHNSSGPRVLHSGGQCWGSWGTEFGGDYINALVEYGGHLVAGGDFVSVRTTIVNNVARLNGDTWEPLGTGIGDSSDKVYGLVVWGGKLVAATNTGVYLWIE